MLSNKKFLFKTFLFLIIIEAISSIYILASIPVDNKNAMFFGFSATRLLFLGVLGSFLFTAILMLVYSIVSNLGMQRMFNLIENLKQVNLLLVSLFVIFILGIIFFLIPSDQIGNAIYKRLEPVVFFVTLFSLQALLFQFIWFGKKINISYLIQWKTAYLSAGISFAIVFVSWLFIVFSKIGIVPESTGWAPPGTPVLPQQVLISLSAGFLFFWFVAKKNSHKYRFKTDTFISILLWGIAMFLWSHEPLQDWSYFTAEPTPPNFEVYPYSDAALYDTFAQNYLIGTSLQYGLTHRPGYAIFLALLHSIVGQNYDFMLIMQIIILALGAPVLYLLTSKFSGQPAGILASLIFIFREKNAIALTNVIEVSHSKLLMSDVPTMVLMIVFIYFLVCWLQQVDKKIYLGIIAGAFLGLVALIRSQALICIPIVLFCVLIAKRKALRFTLLQVSMFLSGVFLIVSPWVWRNYQVSGRVLIEYQNAYTTVIASGYTDNPNDIIRLSNENLETYENRMFDLIFNYIKSNPLEVARFYTSYFVHNEISAIVYLPMAIQFWDIKTYVHELNLWGWNPVFSNPTPKILLFFFLTLALIALGIGEAYQRAKWIGFVPLFIHLGYSFSVVPFKTSGWRFILPVDWILNLYFSIGLMHFILIIFSLFSQRKINLQHEGQIEEKVTEKHKTTILILVGCLVIGLLFPLVERMMPQKYPVLSESDLINKFMFDEILLDNNESISVSGLKMFIETEPASAVVYGGALYPSFYEAGEFWGDDDSYPLEMRNISRLQFLLIGPLQRRIYLPVDITPETTFPNAANVFVIGCETKAGIRALLIQVNNAFVFHESPWRGFTCDSP